MTPHRPIALRGLVLGASLLAVLCAAGASAESRRIAMDGYFDDWSDATPVWVDPTGDGGTDGIDLGSIWAADDAEHFYLRFEVGPERLGQSGNQIAIFIDADDNPATGFPASGMGAELRWTLGDRQGIFFVGADFVTIPWDAIGFVAMPSYGSSQFEIVIDRDAVPDGVHALFTSPTIRFLIHDLNGDWAPNSGTTIPYAFDQGTLPELPTVTLAPSGAGSLRLLEWNVLNDGLFDAGKQPSFRRVLQAANPDVISFEEIYNHDATQTRALIQSWLGGTWAALKVSDKIVLTRGTITNSWSIAGGRAGAFLLSPPGAFTADVLVIACHLSCCDADAARQSQVDQIMAFVRDAQTPGGLLDLTSDNTIVITGDMNFVGSSRQLLTLLTGDIYDNASYGPDFAPDWDGTDLRDQLFRQPTNLLGYTWFEAGNAYWPSRLDLVIFSDSQTHMVKNFALQTDLLPPEFLAQYGLQAGDTPTASDHLPCVVDLAPGTQDIADERPGSSARVRLALAGPNPSAGRIALRLSVGEGPSASLALAVVDAAGRRVATLARDAYAPGMHAIAWDGTDEAGRPAPSGAYWVRVDGAPRAKGVRVVLVR